MKLILCHEWGAVGIGGLSGLVLGLRGGMFKRLLYTTTGAGIIGCICFPKEAKQTLNTVEHYGNISYNFVYGVKPGNSPQDISLIDMFHLKSVFESEYFRMITFDKFFEQKKENTTEKLEESTPANKPEKEKKWKDCFLLIQKIHKKAYKIVENIVKQFCINLYNSVHWCFQYS